MGLQTRLTVNLPWYDSFNLTADQNWLSYYIILASLYNFTFDQNIHFPPSFFICFFAHKKTLALSGTGGVAYNPFSHAPFHRAGQRMNRDRSVPTPGAICRRLRILSMYSIASYSFSCYNIMKKRPTKEGGRFGKKYKAGIGERVKKTAA